MGASAEVLQAASPQMPRIVKCPLHRPQLRKTDLHHGDGHPVLRRESARRGWISQEGCSHCHASTVLTNSELDGFVNKRALLLRLAYRPVIDQSCRRQVRKLAAEAIDVITLEPKPYERTSPQNFRLWSIGWDKRDNHVAPIPANSAMATGPGTETLDPSLKTKKPH